MTRTEVLSEIDDIQNKHCEGCQVRGMCHNSFNYCVPGVCLIAKRINELGRTLINTKAPRIKKSRRCDDIKINYKDVEILEFTKENVITLQKRGKTNEEIKKICNVSNTKFYNQKKEWGMFKGRGRKTTGSELKKVEKVVKEEAPKDVVSVEEYENLKSQLETSNGIVLKFEKMLGEKENKLDAANNNIEAAKETIKSQERNIAVLNDALETYNRSDVGNYEEILYEKDNLIKKLHDLRSEDVKVIDELKTKIDTIENLKEEYYNKYSDTENELEASQEQLGDQSVELEKLQQYKTFYELPEEKMIVAEDLSDFEIKIHENCNDLAQILVNKNRDYGDSFRKLYDEYGDYSTGWRLTEKLNRFKTLITEDNLIKGESKDDTLLDIAGYSVLTLATKQLSRVGE